MAYRNLTPPDKDELAETIKREGRRSAAELLGMSLSTLARWQRIYNLPLKAILYPESLTPLQEDILTASMLGDGHIRRDSSRFAFSQAPKRREYVEYVHEVLSPFSRPIHTSNGQPRFETTTHRVFAEIRDRWYPDGIKIVPSDVTLNDYILAHWVIQDGCNNQGRKAINLSTHCFSEAEVKLLVAKLADIDILATVQHAKGKPIVSIGARQYAAVIERLTPYIPFNCCFNKIDMSKVETTRAGWGAAKLSRELATEIRRLRRLGVPRKELAQCFDVSDSTIGRVAHNLSYRSTIHIGGGAPAAC